MVLSHRTIISLCMTILYLLIVLTPLAPMILHSPRLAHAITGECSGDCSICGCAPERSAARACCCWQNRRAAEHRQQVAKRHDTETEPEREPQKLPSCCQKKCPSATTSLAKNTELPHDPAPAPDRNSEQHPNEDVVTAISSCPCDSGKQLFTGQYDSDHHVPIRYCTGIPIVTSTTIPPLPPGILVSRSAEPPVPPPKISLSC